MIKKYDGLLGMRGLGALMVVAYHVYVLNGCLGKSFYLDHTVGLGGAFVSMFFMISAFSCMCGYFRHFSESLDSKTLSLFYINRAKKLIPTFWFALFLHCIIRYVLGNAINFSNVFGTASLLYGFMPQYRDSMVQAGWTLGIEIIFYLIFPAFTVACHNKKRNWFFLIFSYVLLLAYFNYYAVGASEQNNTELNIIRHLVYFVVGALIYHYSDFIEKIPYKKVLYPMHLIIQLLAFYCYLNVPISLTPIFVCIFFSIMVINQIGFKDYLINNKFFKWVGKYSYQIYIFHMIIFNILSNIGVWENITNNFGWKINFIIFYLLEITLTLIFSIAFNLSVNLNP